MPPACCEPSVRPWKAFWNETMVTLRSPPMLWPWVRQSLMAHSTVSEPVVSRKTFFSGSGRIERSFSTSFRRGLVGETVGGEQAVVDLGADRGGDARGVVAGVGDQHAGGPVDPAVAPGVVDRKAFGAVPDDRRLALHGYGLGGLQPFEQGHRFRHWKLRHDAAEGRFDARDGARLEVVNWHCG